ELKTNISNINLADNQPIINRKTKQPIIDETTEKTKDKQAKQQVEIEETKTLNNIFTGTTTKHKNKIPASIYKEKTITKSTVSISNTAEKENKIVEIAQNSNKNIAIEEEKKDSSSNVKQATTDSLVFVLNNKLPIKPNKKQGFSQHLSIGGGWLFENNQQFTFANQVPGIISNTNFSNANPGTVALERNINSFIENGRYFQAAWLLQYHLSKHWKIEIGLQYSFLTNTLKTGAKKDTNTANFSNTFYYANGNNFSRTNYMHQLSVPLTLQYAFNVKKTNPILFGTGIVVTKPIAHNWLVHNTTNGIAYYQDQLMPSFYLQLQSKISIPVNRGWYVHALYQQQLNALHKNNLSTKFLSQFGIQISKKIK
ncbi:MAG: hypothetical protein ACOVNR_09675, partial [Chitinophagaceae bacterium]